MIYFRGKGYYKRDLDIIYDDTYGTLEIEGTECAHPIQISKKLKDDLDRCIENVLECQGEL